MGSVSRPLKIQSVISAAQPCHLVKLKTGVGESMQLKTTEQQKIIMIVPGNFHHVNYFSTKLLTLINSGLVSGQPNGNLGVH